MIPGVEAFKCHGDPSSVSHSLEKWRKSFEYFLTMSGIINDGRREPILHMAGSPTGNLQSTHRGRWSPSNLHAGNGGITHTKNVPFKRSKQESQLNNLSPNCKLSEFCDYEAEREISDQLIAACSSKRYRKKMQEKCELT